MRVRASLAQAGFGRSVLSVVIVSTWLGLGVPNLHAQTLTIEPDVIEFIDRVSERHGVPREELSDLLGEARIQESVLEAISRPAEAKPWYEYRPIFLTDARIDGGVGFWREHADTLRRAESTYGVAPQYIVAIIGVETFYGRHEGKTRVLDSLATLAFRYPRRSEFFMGELEQFVLLVREEGLDARSLMGSYAGAMGMPQFIASSYRRYAVDFDADRVRDLIASPADAIGSVANYLEEHGWRPHEQVVFPVQVSGSGYRSILAKGLEPATPLSAMTEQGVKIYADDIDRSRAGALVELELQDGREYWVGLKNFYTITRYNHSGLYAMAVAQLAESIERRYRQTP